MRSHKAKRGLSYALYRARYVYRLGQKRMGRTLFITLHATLALLLIGSAIFPFLAQTGVVHALAAGGDTAVVDPETQEPISILENGREPESPNIQLVIPSLGEADDGYYYLVVTSITGGTLKDQYGGEIEVGTDGSELYTNGGGWVDFWFTPTANRNVDASFTYVLHHYDEAWESYDTSPASTVTIPITPVDVAPTLTTTNGWTGTGLTGTYYRTDYDLTGVSTTKLDPTINFDSSVTDECGQTVWDVADMCPDDFSVRWTGQVKAPVDGDYSFQTNSDDGVRLWVDGQLLIDNWTTHGPTLDTSTDTLHFAAGSTHDIELDYYERGGGEVIDLTWAYDADLEDYEDIPTADLYPGTIRPELTYVVGSAAVVADDGIKIGDVDSTTMSGATVQIIGNYQNSEDSLVFANQHGISGIFNSTNGTLTLTGTASIADYQAALRSVKYYNSNPGPDTDTRTLRFVVNDGEKNSNFTTRDISFSSENSPPDILEGANTTVTMSEDADPVPFSLTLDANDPNFDPVNWNISSPASHGTTSVDPSGNTVTVHYTPSLHFSGSDSFIVRVSDGQGGTDTITVHVTVTPFSDDDGIDTSIEDAAPNSGDANHDGTLDSKQSNVASFVSPITNHYAAIVVDDTCTLTGTSVIAPSTPDTDATGYRYPLGLMDFTADCGIAGFTATITQYYYGPPTGTFLLRKLTNTIYETVPGATLTRTTIGGQAVLVVSYHVTDGSSLDADGEIDGIIVDPAGPASALTVAAPGVPNTGALYRSSRIPAVLFITAGALLLAARYRKRSVITNR